MKFKEIWKVNVKSIGGRAEEEYNSQFILMNECDIKKWHNTENKADVYTDYGIDLTGDLCYNTEFYISEVLEVIKVSKLEDVLKVCKENNLSQDKINQSQTVKGLFVGASYDDLLKNDLELITDYKLDMPKNEWIKTDETQWVKYLECSDNLDHWFKVVDCIIVDNEDKSYCVLKCITVNVNEEELLKGAYDNVIKLYYGELDNILDCKEFNYPQIIAEMLAETSLYGYGEGSKIFEFEINKEEDLYDQIYSKVEEVERYIKANL